MTKTNLNYVSYLKTIKKGLPYPKLRKRGLFDELEDSIQSFLNENPGATMADIEARFGTAEDIIASHLHGDPLNIHKSLSLKKRIFILFVISAFIIITIILFSKVLFHYDIQEFKSGYFVSVVQEETPPESLPIYEKETNQEELS